MNGITDRQITELRRQEAREGWLGEDPGEDMQWLLDHHHWRETIPGLRHRRLMLIDPQWHALFGFLYNGKDPILTEMDAQAHGCRSSLSINWKNFQLEPRSDVREIVPMPVVREKNEIGSYSRFAIWGQRQNGFVLAEPRAIGQWLQKFYLENPDVTLPVIGGLVMSEFSSPSFAVFYRNPSNTEREFYMEIFDRDMGLPDEAIWLFSKK